MWDDSKYNKSVKNDLFIFCENDYYLTVHFILKVSNPNKRLPSWAVNIGQTNRNVLYLSTKIATIDWKIWIYSLHCAKKIQGTSSVLKGKKNIINYIKNILHVKYNQ